MNEGLESLQDQIKKLTAIVKDNNAMLVSIQRRARFSIMISVIKWLFILGVTFGSFFFLQPYLDSLMETYSSVSNLSNPFTAASATTTDSGLINALREYLPR